MISSKYDIVLGIGLVFLLLTISFAGEGRFDILAKNFFVPIAMVISAVASC
jgi:hypothetical protein